MESDLEPAWIGAEAKARSMANTNDSAKNTRGAAAGKTKQSTLNFS